MVSGTPVIAMAMDSAPEIIAHGKAGFLCHTVEECIEALAKVAEIDRRAGRQHVEQYFSLNSMVDGYEAVYQNMLVGRFSRNGRLQFSSVVP